MKKTEKEKLNPKGRTSPFRRLTCVYVHVHVHVRIDLVSCSVLFVLLFFQPLVFVLSPVWSQLLHDSSSCLCSLGSLSLKPS